MCWIALGYIALAAALMALALPATCARRVVYLIAGWVSALLVVVAAVVTFIGASSATITLHLSLLPDLGFALNSLRAFFLLITAAVYAASLAFVVRDSGSLSAARERALLALTTLLQATMITVLISSTVLSFLFFWELMSLALWALVSFDTHDSGRIRAGLLTLALTEAGALAGLAGLLILAAGAGSTHLAAIATAAPHLSPAVVWTATLLTFFGFGVKTGVVPVNLWMREGYAAAPRSLLPIFSGATLNLGVFALVIIDGPLASHALVPALIILAVGALTALLGIVYALVQTDMTGLLTESSIENLGIVVAALGAGFAFSALGKPALAGISIVAGLYHMLNHSTYKTLLFLGAGGIGAATGTQDLDRLGGLMRRVPLFGTLFLIGTLAIAALPPFNGFASEWLVLESLLRVVEVMPLPVRMVFALSGAALALTAGLALTCFILLAGTSLLGIARSAQAAAVRRMPRSVTAPMAVLAVLCLLLGISATAIIPGLARLVAPLAGADATPALVPAFFHGAPGLPAAIAHDLGHIGTEVGRGVLPVRGLAVLHSGGTATPVVFAMSTALTFAVVLTLLGIVWFLAKVVRRRPVRRGALWDAGLARLRPEMTYNATGFAAPVRVLFNNLLRPVVAERVERQGAFAMILRREAQMVHIVDRFTLHPLISRMRKIAAWLARMHHGRINAYAGYVLLALVALLLASSAVLH